MLWLTDSGFAAGDLYGLSGSKLSNIDRKFSSVDLIMLSSSSLEVLPILYRLANKSLVAKMAVPYLCASVGKV